MTIKIMERDNKMRKASVNRQTKETKIDIRLNVDGKGEYNISSPIAFLSHMLESFAKHGLFDISLKAEGDMQVDQHHTVEDCGIVLGMVFNKALGSKKGINRTGYFVFPMDDALASVSVDLSGRPFLIYNVQFKRRFCGDFDTDLLKDFFQGFAVNLKANIAIQLLYGKNDHHKIEAIFKALGKAMKMACSIEPRLGENILSTKGCL